MAKAYEKYKPTGLPWLKTTPRHWDLLRNKAFFSENKIIVGKNHGNYQLLSLTKRGVIVRDMTAGGKFPTEFDSYKTVVPGQIIFCLFDVDETPRTVGLSQNHGMITGSYDVFSIHGINPQYLQYYYIALDDTKALKPLYTGLRKVIHVSKLMQTKLPVPSDAEQDQIVRYLDWKTSEIMRLIAAKKKQIKLLEEKKRATINEAVTHGINPAATMHDSGIPWLGAVPDDWEPHFIFQCATEQHISNRTVHNQNLLSLSYGKIVNKDIETITGLLPASFDTYQIVNDGNIILRLTDLQNDKTSLRVGLATQTGIITSAYVCLHTRENILPNFLYYLLHSYDLRKVFYGMGGGIRQGLNFKEISRLPVMLPPIEEQNAIVEFCITEENKINTLIDAIKREIALIQEYKVRLISDVVTGQIDVRHITVPETELVANEVNESEDENKTEEVDDNADS